MDLLKKLLIYGGGGFVVLFVAAMFLVDTPPPESINSKENTNNNAQNSELSNEPTSPPPSPNAEVTPKGEVTYLVTKVVDGDTLDLTIEGKTVRVRLIGIDTPETVDPRKPVQCFGKEASNKTKEFLQGKMVSIEKDASQGELDKYQRLLVYIFLNDGRNFNKLLIEEGYAHEYTYDLPYKYQSEFKEAERIAREQKRGLWADNACKTTPSTPTPPPAKASPAPITPPPASSKYICSYNAYNCDDFSTHAEAQSVFQMCGGLNNDVHALDRDADGIACETLP